MTLIHAPMRRRRRQVSRLYFIYDLYYITSLTFLPTLGAKCQISSICLANYVFLLSPFEFCLGWKYSNSLSNAYEIPVTRRKRLEKNKYIQSFAHTWGLNS